MAHPAVPARRLTGILCESPLMEPFRELISAKEIHNVAWATANYPELEYTSTGTVSDEWKEGETDLDFRFTKGSERHEPSNTRNFRKPY